MSGRPELGTLAQADAWSPGWESREATAGSPSGHARDANAARRRSSSNGYASSPRQWRALVCRANLRAAARHKLSRRDARRVAVRAQWLHRQRPTQLLGLVRRITLLQI